MPRGIVSTQRNRVPDASSLEIGGPRLQPGGGRARTSGPARRSAPIENPTRHPRGRYPPRRRAGFKVSGSFERPLGQATGPRLKRASGSLQEYQLLRLNRSVGAGFEPATKCVIGICSTRLSYPLLAPDRIRTGDLRVSPALCQTELRMPRSSFDGTRDTQSAPRRPGPTARTRSQAKGRAYDADGS